MHTRKMVLNIGIVYIQKFFAKEASKILFCIPIDISLDKVIKASCHFGVGWFKMNSDNVAFGLFLDDISTLETLLHSVGQMKNFRLEVVMDIVLQNGVIVFNHLL